MININILKAKSIAHDIRRAERSKEFEPLDSLIAKQIPGADIAVIEGNRQIIRDKYAEIQISIDSAETIEELKNALS
ncbi:hypothetical protein UFOVP1309_48 [uncultured Caudovirales phage]|uniref:Uncharacterized protein n=1 Tax=uncultured Caudovirales phage TaxID=2100421 RepID=A0A6J5RV34_9CAUD|nr:hypothetical protein UFOVP1309_48 [uncultured Caudovirales phage]